MIIDSLSNAHRYYDLHPLFKKAFDYLNSDFGEIPSGTIELDGQSLKAIVSDADLKSKADAKLETHKKYIDIQMPLSKEETFGWKSLSKLENPIEEFNETKDIGFYHDKPSAYIAAQPGEFLIFFPEDAHAPLIGKGETRKVILKIEVQ